MKALSLLVSLVITIVTLVLSISNQTDYVNLQNKALQESITRGSLVYEDFCVTCHLDSGKGVKNVFPPLANSDFLKNNRALSIKSLKYGLNGKITVNGKVYNSNMAAQGLNNDEIADVMNYINHSWGNAYGPIVTEQEVEKIKK